MIITNDEKFLRLPCELVKTEDISQLIEILDKELDYSNKLGTSGIGLAATQIGVQQKAAIVRIGKLKINLINCEIANMYDKTVFTDEGCLSFPSITHDTYRYQEIHVINNAIEPYNFIATGLAAVVVQHEIGHFNSDLFMDHKVPKPITINKRIKIGPNEKCPCGQIDLITKKTKKYKKCCGK